jgi:hypothetical protein
MPQDTVQLRKTAEMSHFDCVFDYLETHFDRQYLISRLKQLAKFEITTNYQRFPYSRSFTNRGVCAFNAQTEPVPETCGYSSTKKVKLFTDHRRGINLTELTVSATEQLAALSLSKFHY